MEPAPKAYHHGDLRSAMVASGLELLEQKGLDALSLRAVAARVGVSHTAPQNHFEGVTGLRTAIATEGFWRMARQMKLAERGVPASDRTRAIARAYLDFACGAPALFQLMFDPMLCDPRDWSLVEAAGACAAIWRDKSASKPDEKARQAQCITHGFAALAASGHVTFKAREAVLKTLAA